MPSYRVARSRMHEPFDIDCQVFSKKSLDLIPEALFFLDIDRRIVFINKKGTDLLNYEEPSYIIGDSLVQYIAPEDVFQVETTLDRCFSNRTSAHLSFSFLRSDGRRIPIAAVFSLADDSEGHPQGYICVSHSESQFANETSRLESISNRALLYFDLLNHDISNQLQAILSATELLQYQIKGTLQEQLLGEIVQSISRCNGIIESAATMERILSCEIGERCLRDAIHNSLMRLIETHDVQVEASLEIGTAPVRADDFLEWLFLSFLDNACRHNSRPEKQIWVKMTEQDGNYSIVISDNGPGIPDAQKDQLFDAGMRSGGLSLHLCRLIAEKYGAVIKICDRIKGHPEQGTRVELSFPKLNHS